MYFRNVIGSPNRNGGKYMLKGAYFLVTLVLSIGFSIHLAAQVLTGGQINGTIMDSTGAVIADATVTLTNQQTGVQRSTVTNGTGYFVIRSVQPGQYGMSVSKEGFRTTTLPSFSVTVGQVLTQNEKLEIGRESQTVKVSADAEGILLQKSSSELGLVIDQKEVAELPLNGRNFTELLILTPGVTPVSTSQLSLGNGEGTAPGIPGSAFVIPTIFGQQNRSVVYLLDGVSNTNFRMGSYSFLPIIDATTEFKVQSHNDNAEYGGSLGGVINMASKSGTNHFHGNAWEFNRSNFGQARNPFTDFCSPSRCAASASSTTPAPPVHFLQNQYGATFGGPILRNRTFFFGAYEGWHYVKPLASTTLLPTAAEEAGDFSNSYYRQQIYNPYSTTCSGGNCVVLPFQCDSSGNPIATANGIQSGGTPCNKIPSTLISGVSTALLTNYVLAPNAPSGPGYSYNFIDERPSTSDAKTWQIRLDEALRQKDFGFFRLSQMWVDTSNPRAGLNSSSNVGYHAYNFGGGWTHMLSQNLVLEGHLGVLLNPYKTANYVSPSGYASMTAAGLKVDDYQGMVFALSSPYGAKSGGTGPAVTQIFTEPNWSGGGSVSWLHGRHSIKMGIDWLHLLEKTANDYQTTTFTDAVTSKINASGTGNSLASMLLGLPASYQAYNPTWGTLKFSWSTWSGYIQDSWKVKPNFTVNMGVRYDYNETVHPLSNTPSSLLDLYSQQYIIGRSSVPLCSSSTTFVSPCLPVPLSSVPYASNISFAGNFPIIAHAIKDNIQPRLGFSWQIEKNIVLRGGYGIFYDQNNGRAQDTDNEYGAAAWPWTRGIGPYSENVAQNGIWPGGPGNPLTYLTSIIGSTGPSTVASSPWATLGGNSFTSKDFTDARSQQYSLQIQQQLDPSTILTIGYAGSKNNRLAYDGNANAARTPSPQGTPLSAIDALKLMPWVPPTLNYQQSTGTSNYNALIASFERRLSKSLTTIASYTWSKSMDMNSGLFGGENGSGGATVQNFFDPHNAYGPSGYNVPNNFTWTSLYELPFGPGQRWLHQGVLAYVAGNWTTSYVFMTHTGQNYNLSVGGDPANISGNNGTVSGYSRPNVVGNPLTGSCGSVPIGQKGTGGYCLYNPSAFSVPVYSFGNMGRNTLHAPEYNAFDLSVMKSVPIHDSISVQIRVDAFNLLNIQVPSVPTTTTTLAAAGLSTSIVTTPRQLQFSGKIFF